MEFYAQLIGFGLLFLIVYVPQIIQRKRDKAELQRKINTAYQNGNNDLASIYTQLYTRRYKR